MADQPFTHSITSQWLKGDGPEADIIVSSRVRLARNLAEYPFPILATDSQAKELRDKVHQALRVPGWEAYGRFHIVNLEQLTPLEKRVMVEKHLLSPALAEESRYGGLIYSEDESVSIMINEEDHLRIQCLFSGKQLRQALQRAMNVDDLMEQTLVYAFDEKWGYLTSCPTNVGTGIRASVMIHLPGLVLTQQINRVLAAISKVGLVVRGIYGEGSEAQGNLFQISNQITLGLSEEEIIDNIDRVVSQIVRQERAAREHLLQNSREKLADRVYRSLGVLTHARIIDSKEAAERISDVKLGIDLGIIQGVTANLNELLIMTQPGYLQQMAGKTLSSDERDLVRAQLIRDWLAER